MKDLGKFLVVVGVFLAALYLLQNWSGSSVLNSGSVQDVQGVDDDVSDAAPVSTSVTMPSDSGAACIPRESLKPQDLLPANNDNMWGSAGELNTNLLDGQRYLAINTVSDRVKTVYSGDLRSAPPNPRMAGGWWNISPLETSGSRRQLEIGSN